MSFKSIKQFISWTQTRSSKITLGISIFVIVMGALNTYLGNARMEAKIDEKKMPEAEDGTAFDAKNKAVGFLIMVGGILSIVVGVVGLFAVKKMHCFCTSMLMCCSFFTAIFLFQAAMAGLTISGYTGNVIMVTCIARRFTTLDEDYKLLIDRYMCSSICPCPEEAESSWLDVSESTLNKYTRTRSTEQGDLTEKQFMDGETLVPLKFDSSGTSYDTYEQCYENVLKEKFKKEAEKAKNETKKDDETSFGDRAGNLLQDSGLVFLEGLESIGKCASICNKPLFYITQPVEKGPVPRDCMTALKYELSFKLPSNIALLSALALFAQTLISIPLCCKFINRSNDNNFENAETEMKMMEEESESMG